jgi:hypothetical protein
MIFGAGVLGTVLMAGKNMLLQLDITNFREGNYYYRVLTKNGVQMIRFAKL